MVKTLVLCLSLATTLAPMMPGVSAGRPSLRAGAGTGQGSPVAGAERGFEHFYNLEHDAAIAEFEKLVADQPDNPFFHNYLALALLYREFYRRGVLEGDLFGESNRIFGTATFTPDPRSVGRLKQAYNRAIEISEARLKKNPPDQDTLYTLGSAYSTKASYLFVVERSWFGALRAGTLSRNPHQQLIEKNPQYYDAYLIPGVHDYVVGSLPAFIKVVAFLGGFHGNREEGIRNLELVAQRGAVNKIDAQLLLSVAYRRERRFADARRILSELISRYPRNHILPLEVAGLYAKEGNYEAAIRQYEEVLEKVRAEEMGFDRVPVARLNYRLGELYQRRQNFARARASFQAVEGSAGASPQLAADAQREIRKLPHSPIPSLVQ